MSFVSSKKPKKMRNLHRENFPVLTTIGTLMFHSTISLSKGRKNIKEKNKYQSRGNASDAVTFYAALKSLIHFLSLGLRMLIKK